MNNDIIPRSQLFHQQQLASLASQIDTSSFVYGATKIAAGYSAHG